MKPTEKQKRKERRIVAKQKRIEERIKATEFFNYAMTPEERDHFRTYHYNVLAMKELEIVGLQKLDERGRILIQCSETLVTGHKTGKEFFEEMILFFEQEDDVDDYKYCAQAKELLESYIEKFQK